MEQSSPNLGRIGGEILSLTRSELYLDLPYLDAALCGLRFAPGDGLTLSLATDGETLFYNGSYLAERYLRGSAHVDRAYLHIILHCMLRHLSKKSGREPQLWDLACDIAVESILDALALPRLGDNRSPGRNKVYGECLEEMKVLTAEGVYLHFRRARPDEYRLAQLQRDFLQDDHGLWDPPRRDGERNARQDRKWKDLSEKTQTGLETVLAGKATGGEPVLEQIRVAVRDEVDFRAFLRRFAAPREVMHVDGDAFDPIYYAYGLEVYGNMPLVEPPESREEKRIEDLVLAIDTSMSTQGETVRRLLACTYSVLRSTETFTRKVRIHLIQCDNMVREETVLRDLDDLRAYMERFTLHGGSATDFRPVFDRVRERMEQGAFTHLRGLIYFTDGMGVYPEKRPPYETAFVLPQEPPLSIPFPTWAVKLVLGERDVEKAIEETEDWEEPEALPQL